MANNADKKNEARLKREQAQAQAAAAAKRNKMLQYLAGAVFAAIVVVVLVVVVTGSKDESVDPKSAEVAGVAETKKLLTGLDQDGFTLGDPKAPITIVEVVDLQCPFCKSEQLDGQPQIIAESVRTGKAKLRLVPLGFLGPDSEDARAVMARLANSDKAWAFANLFYWNQGQENTGYVTDAFLKKITRAAGGTDADALAREPSDADAKVLAENDALAAKLLPGGPSTPTYAVGKSSAKPETYEVVDASSDVASAVIEKVNELSGGSSSSEQ